MVDVTYSGEHTLSVVENEDRRLEIATARTRHAVPLIILPMAREEGDRL